jgi:hypothetical protein
MLDFGSVVSGYHGAGRTAQWHRESRSVERISGPETHLGLCLNHCRWRRAGSVAVKVRRPLRAWQCELDKQRRSISARGLLHDAIGRPYDAAHGRAADRHAMLCAGIAADAAMQGTGRDANVLPRHVIFALMNSADRAVSWPSAGDSVRNFRAEVIAETQPLCFGSPAL